ncbi:hypothetical protein TeGR_g8865 [Tetraparma gracilis]|uniref:Uncharacterized protein n=1 Tax=Tetraparma gracilis TaxID=2962635 RepID=A0ABQ6MFH6_9STRA|nr:hypothetical protein TeGR_g8865 [Tetraparma gracilis]
MIDSRQEERSMRRVAKLEMDDMIARNAEKARAAEEAAEEAAKEEQAMKRRAAKAEEARKKRAAQEEVARKKRAAEEWGRRARPRNDVPPSNSDARAPDHFSALAEQIREDGWRQGELESKRRRAELERKLAEMTCDSCGGVGDCLDDCSRMPVPGVDCCAYHDLKVMCSCDYCSRNWPMGDEGADAGGVHPDAAMPGPDSDHLLEIDDEASMSSSSQGKVKTEVEHPPTAKRRKKSLTNP